MDLQIVNTLLCSLSPENRDLLVQASRPVRLRRNRVLFNEGEPATHAYFLQSGLASIMIEASVGEQVEVGMIGSEGVVGLPALFGSARSATSCILQMEATALEIPIGTLCMFFQENVAIRQRLLQYEQMYLYGTERVAACNRVHLAPERLVRWLLMAQLYSHVGQLPFTHEFLAQMVAVQRSTISAALNSLQAEGLLDHGWGMVTLKEPDKLRAKACSCYKVLKELHQTLYRD